MTNQQYLKKLQRLLKPLNNERRKEIILELESLYKEHNDPEFSLEQRFGKVEDLANQYLDGIEQKTNIQRKFLSIGKYALISIGALFVMSVSAAAFILYSATEDDFNYADLNDKNLDITNVEWTKLPLNENLILDFKRTFSVLYWHDNNELYLKCSRNVTGLNEVLNNGKLHIHNNRCLIYLPKYLSNITGYQSKLTIINPQSDLNINIKQTNLRIAETGSNGYNVTKEESKYIPLSSASNPTHIIAINAVQSKIEPYEY